MACYYVAVLSCLCFYNEGFWLPRWLQVFLPHCIWRASLQPRVSCLTGPMRSLLVAVDTHARASHPYFQSLVCAVIFTLPHTLIGIFTACLLHQLTKCKSIPLLSKKKKKGDRSHHVCVRENHKGGEKKKSRSCIPQGVIFNGENPSKP